MHQLRPTTSKKHARKEGQRKGNRSKKSLQKTMRASKGVGQYATVPTVCRFWAPIFQDDQELSPSFTLAAFDFLQLGGSQWFVNATAGEQGLQFPPQGAEITLP